MLTSERKLAVDEIREAIRRLRPTRESKSFLGVVDGTLNFQLYKAEELAEVISKLQSSLDAIQSCCTVVGGIEVLNLDAEFRQSFVQVFPPSTVDSLAVAKSRNLPIWTDDLLTGEIAHKEMGIDRLWTQAVWESETKAANRSGSSSLPLSVRLYLSGYFFSQLSINDILAMCSQAGWSTSKYPCKEALSYIKRYGVTDFRNTNITAGLLNSIWFNSPKERYAKRVIVDLLNLLDQKSLYWELCAPHTFDKSALFHSEDEV